MKKIARKSAAAPETPSMTHGATPRAAKPAPRAARSAPPTVTVLTPEVSVASMVESVVGCKWSLHVLAMVRKGVNRPGVLARSAAGLTPKVLSERLEKFLRFGIFERVQYPEIPPRVEYRLTPLGERFVTIIDAVEAVQKDLDH